MVNQQKIIAMTKLALYDKHEGAADREANNYFRHDYIYKKNFSTRIAAGIGGFVLLAIYWLRVFFVEEVDIFKLDIQQVVEQSLLFIVAIVALYSLFGTIQGTREYFLMQKRLEKYNNILKFLENVDERAKRIAEEKEEKEKRERSTPPVSLRDIDESSRRTYTNETEKPDPLANVSARARATSRPRPSVPLTQRPSRNRGSANETPVYRMPKPPEEK